MTGKIKSFSPQHGYGFITSETDEIFFFHATEWKPLSKPLRGMAVEFEPAITEKGSRAKNIRRIKQWRMK